MTIALIIGRNEQERVKFSTYAHQWIEALLKLNPKLDIRQYPDLGDQQAIEFIIVLNPPVGIFKEFPHIKAVFTLTAGVDNVLADTSLLPNIPLVRIEDPFMANDICQYAVTYVLHYMKQVAHWQMLQKNRNWDRHVPFDFLSKTIGVMGLGYLGKKVAVTLSQLGFKVNGWSLSKKEIEHITTYHSREQFIQFLQNTDVLINLVPLTAETRDILNQNTFSHLRHGAYLINIGRGDHLVEEDLLAALETGQLSGATLDVFREEPLRKEHVFWYHPRIIVTPHIASITNPQTAAIPIVENIKRIQNGEAPISRVDLTRGY